VAGRPPTQRQLAAEQTRLKLIAVALDEFSRRPYSEVTVGDIAKAAGVAHGLLSHHFQGKQGLYAEALGEADRQLREVQATDPGLPAGDGVRQRFRAFLTFVTGHEDLALNLILSGTEAGPEAWAAFESTRWQGIRDTCELLGLDPGLPAIALSMRSFAAATDAMTANWLRDGRPFEAELLVEAFTELLTGAIRGAHRLAPALDVTKALSALA
jgi:AcrR family transcriptional regulator